ncbi:hypothetical protein [Dysgonomonas sp. 511]|uniref:hypothetical protein n=1 Tax=Dysgonomonas sp. 511 TaxID=2302930 RepID=UPI0013D6FCCD|nr:hypothetical protein [Dysgonomonas sp. 511]NDV80097.1 hypothetical protein [Dysgonomonas sp. 511]
MNKIKLIALVLVSIVAICISLYSCENNTKNTSTKSTTQMKENDNIYNKVKIVRTKKEITQSMRYLDVTIRNISNDDLSGKPIPIMVHYEDGTVERIEISKPIFRSGDTESWALVSKKNGFGSIEAISCELARN